MPNQKDPVESLLGRWTRSSGLVHGTGLGESVLKISWSLFTLPLPNCAPQNLPPAMSPSISNKVGTIGGFFLIKGSS